MFLLCHNLICANFSKFITLSYFLAYLLVIKYWETQILYL